MVIFQDLYGANRDKRSWQVVTSWDKDGKRKIFTYLSWLNHNSRLLDEIRKDVESMG
jgi:hypothetical protein